MKNTFISFQWQDIELTPKNYSFPIRPRDVDIYTTVGKKIFKEIHTYFQVVNIETDLDFIGFDEFENIKSEIYLKYDEMIIMSNIMENDIYQNQPKREMDRERLGRASDMRLPFGPGTCFSPGTLMYSDM